MLAQRFLFVLRHRRPTSFRQSLARMASTLEVVSVQESKRFIIDCLKSVGAADKSAKQMAEVLVAADCRGHFSHGLSRLDFYVKDVENAVCDPSGEAKILNESSGTAWVDGCNGFGPVVGKFCIDLAIRKAKETGISIVVCKRSNHYGIAGWYSMRALEENLIGLSFTNTSPLLVPTRAKNAALGTNPISLAAPALKDDSLVVDMATTTVAVGKIEVQEKKGEPIPIGWALDETGSPTTDAARAFRANRLYPLGGSELNSGYKGFGLALLVEVLTGILGGSAFGPNVRRWGTFDREANLAQCFIAIDPNCFAPQFEGRMSELLDHLRSMEPSDPDLPVLVPGDPERINQVKVDKMGGIRYHPNQLKLSSDLAMRLKVTPMKTYTPKS